VQRLKAFSFTSTGLSCQAPPEYSSPKKAPLEDPVDIKVESESKKMFERVIHFDHKLEIVRQICIFTAQQK
jgi:hypothetical protein